MRLSGMFLLAVVASAQNWNWRATAPLNEARSEACIARLADGRVLVSGGAGNAPLASSEIYTPAPEESFTPAASLNTARAGHGCALLADGRVLVAGGGATGVELYEPSLDLWTAVEGKVLRKSGTTVLALPDGRVLISGGQAIELEIFDPETSTLGLLPTTVELRDRPSITVLRDGRVLFAGGGSAQGALQSSEILDPGTGEVIGGPSLGTGRSGHSGTLLLDGRVLIAGGSDGQGELNSLEVYLPEGNRFQTLNVTLKEARQSHVALLVPTNGSVLLAGGSAKGAPLATSELFSAADDMVLEAGALTLARSAIAGVVQEDGNILATGGRDAQGPTVACGLLPSPSFRFTQAVYHPLERAIFTGSIGIAAVNGRATFELSRIDALGRTTTINGRLLSSFGTLVNGTLAATPIVDVARDDIGSEFLLTMRVAISNSQIVAVQARFSAKLRTATQVTSLSGATVVGLPIPVRAVVSADGGPVAFSGTLNVTTSGVSATQSVSGGGAAFSVNLSLCCPGVQGVGGSAGSVTASYGGNQFLEPSTGSGTHLVVSNVPALSFSIPVLRLATPVSIPVNVSPSGPPIPTTPSIVIDPAIRPTGTVSLTLNGSTVATALLTIPTVPGFSSVPVYPSAQALLSYTPTILDRRAGTVCLDTKYSGDSRYLALPRVPNTGGSGVNLGDGSVRTVSNCSAVTGAATVLQAPVPPSSYVLGAATPFSVRLTWPDSVGIVSRNVTVLADGRPAGSITLVPDRTGRGIADGTSNLVLPFNARNLTFAYDASGDLLAAQASSTITMAAVSTTMTSTLGATASNPFAIPFSLAINSRGVALPAGTSLGGTIEFRDGDALIGSVPAPVLRAGPGVTDGTSNTISLGEVGLTGVLTNVILPAGRRTITIRFAGSALFQVAQVQVVTTVQ